MKWSRLYQPANPLFWMMLALNGLSPALAWVVHHRPLNGLWLAVIAVFAIGNAVMGLWLAWRLLREPEAPTRPAGDGQDSST